MTEEGLRGRPLTDAISLVMDVEEFDCWNILKSNNLIRLTKLTLYEASVNRSGIAAFNNERLALRIVRTIWDGNQNHKVIRLITSIKRTLRDEERNQVGTPNRSPLVGAYILKFEALSPRVRPALEGRTELRLGTAGNQIIVPNAKGNFTGEIF